LGECGQKTRHPLRIIGNTGALLALVIFVGGIVGTLL